MIVGFGDGTARLCDTNSGSKLLEINADGTGVVASGIRAVRRALIGVYGRLAATLLKLGNVSPARPALVPGAPYSSAEELDADLAVIESSLVAHRGAPLTRARLRPLRYAVQVFGFHLATLDLRQNSDRHEETVAELLFVARLCENYSALNEKEKQDLLLTLLRDARALRVRGASYSVKTAGELSILDAACALRQSFGGRAMRQYIISHTEAVSDLLEILLLLKEGGMMHGVLGDEQASAALIVVPLFETIADLRNAERIMSAFYALPGISALVRASGSVQEVMLGYFHPVAGRMPGQMDVLLAEAGVPYDLIFQLEDINDEFANTDVALVIGANDVVNPAARTDKSSPIFSMPILNADKAKKVYVVKRGRGKGYAGIVNGLFHGDNCDMVYGDAQAVLVKMIEAVRGLELAAAA